MSYSSPIDELQGFLEGNSAATASPNNPLSQGGSTPSANPANPTFNPSNPNAWNNPSNPKLNPSLPSAVNNPSNPMYNPSMPGAQNNPSNYEFNPSMPSAINNPSSPQMNPAYPGAVTNPANPMHNPDFPVHEEMPRPPGISDNASLPPAHAGVLDRIKQVWAPPMSPKETPEEAARGRTCLFHPDRPAIAAEGFAAMCPECYVQWQKTASWRLADNYIDHQLWWKPGQFGRALMSPGGTLHTWPENEMTHAQRLMALGVNAVDKSQWSRYDIKPNGSVGVFTPDEGQALTQIEPNLRPVVSPFVYDREQGKAKPNPYYQASWRIADNYTQDTREWPDPTEPRASNPPAPNDCICRDGEDGALKLHCPIHGLVGQGEEMHDWSMPEGFPVGYPQDQPRGWVDAVHSAWLPIS